MTIKRNVLAAAVLASVAGTAFGANPTLTITGKIVPAACTPTLSLAALDFGEVKANELNADPTKWTALTAKSVDFLIRCTSNAKVSFSVVDSGVGSSSISRYVFGTAAEFEIKHSGSTGFFNDTKALSGLYAGDGTAAWTKVLDAGGTIDRSPARYSFAALGGTQPVELASYRVALKVAPFIKPSKDLTIGDGISLSGVATFQLTYL